MTFLRPHRSRGGPDLPHPRPPGRRTSAHPSFGVEARADPHDPPVRVLPSFRTLRPSSLPCPSLCPVPQRQRQPDSDGHTHEGVCVCTCVWVCARVWVCTRACMKVVRGPLRGVVHGTYMKGGSWGLGLCLLSRWRVFQIGEVGPVSAVGGLVRGRSQWRGA